MGSIHNVFISKLALASYVLSVFVVQFSGNSHNYLNLVSCFFGDLLNTANIYSIYLGRSTESSGDHGANDAPLNYMSAAYRRRDQIVTMLLDHGVDVNTINNLGTHHYFPL